MMKKAVMLLILLITVSAYAQKKQNDFDLFRDKANSLAGKDAHFFKEHLSRQFDTRIGDLDNLFPKFNRNWGDLAIALEFRRITHKPISDIADAFGQKKGWGNIARELGIKPGSPEFKRMKDFMDGYENNWKTEWDKKGKGSNDPHGKGHDKNKGHGKK